MKASLTQDNSLTFELENTFTTSNLSASNTSMDSMDDMENDDDEATTKTPTTTTTTMLVRSVAIRSLQHQRNTSIRVIAAHLSRNKRKRETCRRLS